MYLNLDLLYNINDYFFPLFYYKSRYTKEVYCPITKKSILFYYVNEITGLGLYKKRTTNYYDYITLKLKNYDNKIYSFDNCQFTEKTTISCNPFYLDKKYLDFLTNNIRIN